jgi:4-amino-4-deoxy-L-arabinose transferase-like glycosyltransferase
MSKPAPAAWPVALTSFFLLAFVLMGFAFISQAGLQDDEVNATIYRPEGFAQSVEILGARIPVMLISYTGALKAWIYAPFFWLWKPSPVSLRFPAVLAGGLTIWLFYVLLRRTAGGRAAAVGCVLLSTDTVFLLTTCFDWGPVVLQHLLTVSSALCLVRFHQEGKRRFLAAGFFFFGLGLWDKALFAWVLSGMAIATLVVFPKPLWRSLSPRNLRIAIPAFCLGAAPLILYNVSVPLDTFRSNAAYSTELFAHKARVLYSTFSGETLFGYLVRYDSGGHPRQPQTAMERISVRLSESAGRPVSGFFGYALLAALLLTPWLWRTPARPAIVFSFVTMLVAWPQMAFTKGAGTSAHHAILLWPFPALLTAAAFAEASLLFKRVGKPLLAIALLFLAATSALVTNEYFARLVRNGGGLVWTDAIYPLSDCLQRVRYAAVYVNDWGMFANLWMLSQGQLPLRVGSDPLEKPHLDATDRSAVLDRISDRGAVFVGHTDGNEIFKGVNAKLRDLAAEAGYRRETVADIMDRNGRMIFEVFRFQPPI